MIDATRRSHRDDPKSRPSGRRRAVAWGLILILSARLAPAPQATGGEPGDVRPARLPLDRWARHVIDPAKPWRAVFIAPADLDGDGARDILTGAWWYRNPGRPGGAWERRELGMPLRNMAVAHDFDRDGDLDVLGTTGEGSEPSGEFVWARNDGRGTFSISRAARCRGDFLQGAAVSAFEAGGPTSVLLSWHHGTLGQLGLHELAVPARPDAEPWPIRRLSDESEEEELSLGDIDRDGRTDVLLGVKWLRNEGRGRWAGHVVTPTEDWGDRNRLADINHDGRLDAVVGYWADEGDTRLAWYEQGPDPRAPWPEQVVAILRRPMSLDVADLDGDGDLDIVAGEHNLEEPDRSRLFAFENADGRGGRWTPHLVHEGDEHHDGAQLVDLDGDGDLDITSIGWTHPRVLVYENRAIAGP